MHKYILYQNSVQNLSFTSNVAKFLVNSHISRTKAFTTWLAETATTDRYSSSTSKKYSPSK